MAQDRFVAYSASFDDNASAFHLTQLSSMGIQPNVQDLEIIPAGAIDRAFSGILSADPRVRITTGDLTSLFGSVSITAGYFCPAAGTGAQFRFAKRDLGGTLVAANSAVHFVADASEGFLYVDGLSADIGGQATADLMFAPHYDGTNDPLTASNTTLAQAPAFGSAFYLGALYVNGVQADGLQSCSLSTGINYEVRRGDGEAYGRIGAIVTRAPRWSFTFSKLTHANGIGDMFRVAAPGTIAQYFQKGVAGGDRVAANSAVHCKVSATAGTWGPDDVTATGNDDGSLTVTILPTVAPAVSVASAIP